MRAGARCGVASLGRRRAVAVSRAGRLCSLSGVIGKEEGLDMRYASSHTKLMGRLAVLW